MEVGEADLDSETEAHEQVNVQTATFYSRARLKMQWRRGSGLSNWPPLMIILLQLYLWEVTSRIDRICDLRRIRAVLYHRKTQELAYTPIGAGMHSGILTGIAFITVEVQLICAGSCANVLIGLDGSHPRSPPAPLFGIWPTPIGFQYSPQSKDPWRNLDVHKGYLRTHEIGPR